MSINGYADALAYIYSYIQYDPADISNWNLDRMRELLVRLGNPHKNFPSLLIAGTKGKGTTAAICDSILRAAGYKTGLYTSPHLHSFRERIRLDGDMISEEYVVDLVQKLKSHFETIPGLTAFEVITALAFVAFAEANIDAAVLEVGLGGRLDATNAVDPTVAVITSISYDHTNVLGKTLSLIAREKAGIIRPGALVISAPQVEEAMQMIEKVCQDHQARLISVEQNWEWAVKSHNLDGQTFVTKGGDYWLPLIGDHQVVNAVTAMAAIEGFVERTALEVSLEARKTGIGSVTWLGRMEILSREPYLVVDSAMNGDSIEKLIGTIACYFPDKKKIFVFGASNDHPIRDMLEILLPFCDQTFMVASRHPRAESPEKLTAIAVEMGYQIPTMPDVASALDGALKNANQDGIVCVTGSLFLVGDAREVWIRRNGLPLPPIDPMILS